MSSEDFVKRILNKESKHWGQCDRWVSKFDHHCKWLNNWVGEKNYKYFALLIGFFFLHNLMICLICGFQIIDFHVDEIDFSASNSDFESFYNSKNGNIIRILSYIWCWILLILWWVKTFTTGHLILFHIYLRRNNLTTYKYIMLQRK